MSNWSTDKPCQLCGIEGDGLVCLHHILTKKAYPEHINKDWNLLPTCLLHHQLLHNLPLTKVAEKFPQLTRWLIKNGWYLCEYSNKWRNTQTRGDL